MNLDEQPDKVVGRRAVRATDYSRLVRSAAAIMPRLPFPKGVFRFGTFDEANAWTNEHILQGALKKARAQRTATT